MPDQRKALLFDAEAAAVRERTFAQYVDDELVRSAVERQLGILGEALSALSKLDPALAERVPEVRAIIGMRHVLIHRYARVDHAIVWAAVNERVPRLLQLPRQPTDSL